MRDASDDETPFAHVPVPEAGPIPAQEGPFTYEKLNASIGRGGVLRPGKLPVMTVLVVLMTMLVILAAVWVLLRAFILR
jgi:hypothetical protein